MAGRESLPSVKVILQTEEKQEAPDTDRAGDFPADWTNSKKLREFLRGSRELSCPVLVWPEDSEVFRLNNAQALSCTALASKPRFWYTYRLYQHLWAKAQEGRVCQRRQAWLRE